MFNFISNLFGKKKVAHILVKGFEKASGCYIIWVGDEVVATSKTCVRDNFYFLPPCTEISKEKSAAAYTKLLIYTSVREAFIKGYDKAVVYCDKDFLEYEKEKSAPLVLTDFVGEGSLIQYTYKHLLNDLKEKIDVEIKGVDARNENVFKILEYKVKGISRCASVSPEYASKIVLD